MADLQNIRGKTSAIKAIKSGPELDLETKAN